MKISIVIPARLESTRLDSKLLLPLNGKPILQHVYDNLNGCRNIDSIYIATDSSIIRDTGIEFGAKVLMTSSKHRSGTDRIAEAAMELDCDYIINVQGDEALISKEHISKLTKGFNKYPDADIFTLYERSNNEESYLNSNCVKLVTDLEDFAFYFSRSPIPFNREGKTIDFKKHIGVYAFKKDVLLELAKLNVSALESIEKLEQLRWLENAYKIKAVEVGAGLHSIDTIDDYNLVKSILD